MTYGTDFTYDAATQTKLETMTQRFTDPEQSQRTVTTSFAYDPANPGLVSQVTSPRGHATTFSYFTTGSKAGLLQSVTSPVRSVTSYDFDAIGRVMTLVAPNGQTWSSEYDAEDRLTAITSPVVAGGEMVTRFTYDAVGNRTRVTDPVGQVTQYEYDERDQLIRVVESPSAWTNPGSPPSDTITTEYTYDGNGNVTQVVRAKNTPDERGGDYRYDGLGRLVAERQYPDWPGTATVLVTQHTYDGNGNPTSVVDANGQTTSFGYDGLNRLTAISYTNGTTPDVTFAYDGHGNRTGMTELVSGVPVATTTYGYDERDQLLAVTGRWGYVVGYRYDLDGNRTKVLYPRDSVWVSSAYDGAGRLSSLTDSGGRTTSYGYTPGGQLQTVATFNGTTATYSYDHAERLTGILQLKGAAVLHRVDYTLDLLSNRTAATDAAGATTTYSYDRLSRLTGVTNSDGTTSSYTYDRVGNRLSRTQGGVTTASSDDKVDRLATAGGVAYSHDANGNGTSRGTSSTFTYDQANRLKTATVQGVTTSFAYDGDGNRVRKQRGTCPPTSQVLDVNQALPVLLDDGSRKYVWEMSPPMSPPMAGAILVARLTVCARPGC